MWIPSALLRQIDMFQQVGGKQRSLQDTANSLLRHDPDLMYFGELRTKVLCSPLRPSCFSPAPCST